MSERSVAGAVAGAVSGAAVGGAAVGGAAVGGGTGCAAGVAAGESAGPASLANRNFLLLWQGQAISQLGNQAFALTMSLWSMEISGSASLMGLLLAATTLPTSLLAPLGG